MKGTKLTFIKNVLKIILLNQLVLTPRNLGKILFLFRKLSKQALEEEAKSKKTFK